MELGSGVTEALLAGAESLEVLDSLGDDVVEKLKVDAAGALWNRPMLVYGYDASDRQLF